MGTQIVATRPTTRAMDPRQPLKIAIMRVVLGGFEGFRKVLLFQNPFFAPRIGLGDDLVALGLLEHSSDP